MFSAEVDMIRDDEGAQDPTNPSHQQVLESLVPEIFSATEVDPVSLVNIVLEKLTAIDSTLSSKDQLALLMAIRRHTANSNENTEEEI